MQAAVCKEKHLLPVLVGADPGHQLVCQASGYLQALNRKVNAVTTKVRMLRILCVRQALPKSTKWGTAYCKELYVWDPRASNIHIASNRILKQWNVGACELGELDTENRRSFECKESHNSPRPRDNNVSLLLSRPPKYFRYLMRSPSRKLASPCFCRVW